MTLMTGEHQFLNVCLWYKYLHLQNEYWEDAYRRWVDNMSFLVIKVKVIKVIKLFAWSLESAF